MLQAVKGNEGGYSGLLLHDHPKTHRRINEGAGGRLISLYCATTGAGGVGRSGLKPNQRFGSSVKQRGSRLSQVRCWGGEGTPSICLHFKTLHRFVLRGSDMPGSQQNHIADSWETEGQTAADIRAQEQ